MRGRGEQGPTATMQKGPHEPESYECERCPGLTFRVESNYRAHEAEHDALDASTRDDREARETAARELAAWEQAEAERMRKLARDLMGSDAGVS